MEQTKKEEQKQKIEAIIDKFKLFDEDKIKLSTKDFEILGIYPSTILALALQIGRAKDKKKCNQVITNFIRRSRNLWGED